MELKPDEVGPLHLDAAGYEPKAVALAALNEEFSDHPREHADFIRDAEQQMRDRLRDPQDDLSSPEYLPYEENPDELFLRIVSQMLTNDDLLLHVLRDATDRIVGWQLENAANKGYVVDMT